MPAEEPRSAVEALQAAVIDLLKIAAPVKVLVHDRVYDEVPADNARPKPPYLYVGGVSKERIDLGCGVVWRTRMRLFATGTEFGRLSVWALIEACTAVLDGAEPVLAGRYQRHERIIVVAEGDVIDPPDPKTAFLDLSTVVS